MLHYTVTDQIKISEADLFAATKHASQVRKDNTPYIHHPRYVSVLAGFWAQEYFEEPRPMSDAFSRLGIIRVAGLCHDLIEDQDVSYDLLNLLFGRTVANYVARLSNDKTIKDQEERNDVYCQQLHYSDIDVQIIKAADIYHNAVSVAPNPRFGSKWVKKGRQMLESLDKVKTAGFYKLAEHALQVREELSCGPNIQRERVGEHEHRQNKEDRVARHAEDEPQAAC